MKLIILESGRFNVSAYLEDIDGSDPEKIDGSESVVALDELRGLGKQYEGSAKGVASLFNIYAEHGRMRPHGVTSDQMHHAHYEPDIFEFIKGDIRVFCFIDEGMVILTNTGIKKGKKANPKDVAKAMKVYHRYYEDKQRNKIIIRSKNS